MGFNIYIGNKYAPRYMFTKPFVGIAYDNLITSFTCSLIDKDMYICCRMYSALSNRFIIHLSITNQLLLCYYLRISVYFAVSRQ